MIKPCTKTRLERIRGQGLTNLEWIIAGLNLLERVRMSPVAPCRNRLYSNKVLIWVWRHKSQPSRSIINNKQFGPNFKPQVQLSRSYNNRHPNLKFKSQVHVKVKSYFLGISHFQGQTASSTQGHHAQLHKRVNISRNIYFHTYMYGRGDSMIFKNIEKVMGLQQPAGRLNF